MLQFLLQYGKKCTLVMTITVENNGDFVIMVILLKN